MRTMLVKFLLVFSCVYVVSPKTIHLGKSAHRSNNKRNTDNENDNKEEEKERWLVDSIDYPLYDYQGDAPISDNFDDAKCPPYPEKSNARACRARDCNTDKDCRRSNQRCCFNGCKFTCTDEMVLPAVVDWQLEPRRQSLSGKSWLIKGQPEDYGIETCTTTKEPDDGDPLLCPHGYVCHIDDPGDPENGIPNRGQCIKERTEEEEIRSRRTLLRSNLRGSGRCLLGLTVIRDQTVIHIQKEEQEQCICHKGKIKCGDQFHKPNSKP